MLGLGAAAACVLTTLQLMWGYWHQTYPYSDATPHVYWAHVFGHYALFEGTCAAGLAVLVARMCIGGRSGTRGSDGVSARAAGDRMGPT